MDENDEIVRAKIQRGLGTRTDRRRPQMEGWPECESSWTYFVAISRKLFMTVKASSNRSSSLAFESWAGKPYVGLGQRNEVSSDDGHSRCMT
jgi:hypothetical protein